MTYLNKVPTDSLWAATRIFWGRGPEDDVDTQRGSRKDVVEHEVGFMRLAMVTGDHSFHHGEGSCVGCVQWAITIQSSRSNVFVCCSFAQDMWGGAGLVQVCFE